MDSIGMVHGGETVCYAIKPVLSNSVSLDKGKS